MKKEAGKFIVFEGIDGSGKSTQLRLLANKLNELNIPYYESKEPTTNPIGKLIREQYLSGLHETDEKVRQCLFIADRLDHTLSKEYGLINKLNDGIHVIQDRGYLSGIAYGSLNIPFDETFKLHKVNMDALRPSLTIFLDIDPEISMNRINKSRNNQEIYETLEKQKIISEMYHRAMGVLSWDEGEMFFTVDGSLDISDISNIIWDEIKSMFV